MWTFNFHFHQRRVISSFLLKIRSRPKVEDIFAIGVVTYYRTNWCILYTYIYITYRLFIHQYIVQYCVCFYRKQVLADASCERKDIVASCYGRCVPLVVSVEIYDKAPRWARSTCRVASSSPGTAPRQATFGLTMPTTLGDTDL